MISWTRKQSHRRIVSITCSLMVKKANYIIMTPLHRRYIIFSLELLLPPSAPPRNQPRRPPSQTLRVGCLPHRPTARHEAVHPDELWTGNLNMTCSILANTLSTCVLVLMCTLFFVDAQLSTVLYKTVQLRLSQSISATLRTRSTSSCVKCIPDVSWHAQKSCFERPPVANFTQDNVCGERTGLHVGPIRFGIIF